MRLTHKILIGLLLISATVAGYSLSQVMKTPGTDTTVVTATSAAVAPETASVIGKARPDFSLPNLQGKTRAISEWNGQALLVNFWASWCTPCRQEIPAFINARSRYQSQGFEIIGVAIDQPDMANEVAKDLGVNYPILHGQQAAIEIGQQYGNQLGSLPYSVFIDKQGVIQHVHNQGVLNEDQLIDIIKTLL